MSSRAKIVSRYKAGASHQNQIGELVEAIERAVASHDFEGVARQVISRALAQDSDGSMLGAVYHDGFDKAAFVQALVKKLRSAKILEELAQSLLEELEDRK